MTVPPGVPERPDDYEHEFRFSVASIMPRTVYPASDDVTIRQAIGKSDNLIVEMLDGAEGDEEED